LRFRRQDLLPGQKRGYIIVMGIAPGLKEVSALRKKFDSPAKVAKALAETEKLWNGIADKAGLSTGNRDLDRWLRWVSIQPTLRKFYGCSFLPDFDYGKGGRGWRDLWQDCLGLILNDPREARKLLLSNFSGVRLDGSNATIIGKAPGEFAADRNDIARVWCDHGVWPLLTLELYINKTGDRGILFERAPYFADRHIWRSRKLAPRVKECSYRGTVFEHLLIQNLTQFYNVGAHNHLRLEGADWNDGLDMARDNGESVSFGCMYAANLKKLARMLELCGKDKVSIFSEAGHLLKPCDPADAKAKQKRLEEYFYRVENGASGRTMSVDTATLARLLREKAGWMAGHIRKSEWLPQGFFNGYYDNKRRRVEGRVGKRTRMMLASQAFAVLSGVATDEQVRVIIGSVDKYLLDRKLAGYRLNTDFADPMLDLGRAFSFSYGDKENGAIFSHMVVMYAYALLSRGFKKEGERALQSLYKLAVDTRASRIYPCLPEYFDLSGRGMYSYLTGSASWYLLTLLSRKKPLL
jgi:cellobiose phosphorylase